MIAYDLQCIDGHAFEGWFEDSQAYQSQKKKGLIACPVCNSTRVSRLPSTFAIRASQIPKKVSLEEEHLKKVGKEIVDFVHKNFDNVGCDFAKEALKMHYGVEEPRNIRGVSTKEEEELLKKEGIEFLKIPMPERPDTDA
ncbi:MAG: DUF1178 family protein [Desulfobacterales bacterium]|jgi:hypothetical protein|nr:DUF1178 family protein [Deltaproteobacteria bacterium]